ncbi:MAG: SGNH/GDSL hydrolase family protein [Deltaproteobacteria bacterium]|nr:SGNH/GDSL hydrolase family protein [Deltaproteobacteria bacterium]
MKQKIFWLILLLLTYVSIEALAFLSLSLLKKTRNIDYEPLNITSLSDGQGALVKKHIDNSTVSVEFSPLLGWQMKRNFHSEKININSRGIRSFKAYDDNPPEGVLRISTFGDSFTFGDEISDRDTWQWQLEKINPRLEVLNFGMGAYGLDQAFLRYMNEGVRFKSHIIFVGFIGENIARSVSVFRPFYMPLTNAPLTKPRFILKNSELELLENPFQQVEELRSLLESPEEVLPRLGTNDFFYQTKYKKGTFDFLPSLRLLKIIDYEFLQEKFVTNGYYNESSEAFKVMSKILSKFNDKALANHSLPVFLIFPNRYDLVRFTREKTKIYEPMIDYFNANDYLYVDLMDAFLRYGKGKYMDDFFQPAGHYSPLANRLVSKYLDLYLSKERLYSAEKVELKINEPGRRH